MVDLSIAMLVYQRVAITHGQALMLYHAPGAVMGDGTGSSVSDGLWPWKVTLCLVNIQKTMENYHRKSPFIVENHHL